ncbi:hypothetical protein PoB_004736300 [Plakobranchus ocellatus]|uniref:Uncharacterized protein n=1 Tax=Plakobranchus ocellatus TaxID=259542 RepID=A0AAV4BMR1_9GAST|nr:hypothetical protein PoB_004736300 [Plakobranchus ocellatus]
MRQGCFKAFKQWWCVDYSLDGAEKQNCVTERASLKRAQTGVTQCRSIKIDCMELKVHTGIARRHATVPVQCFVMVDHCEDLIEEPQVNHRDSRF